MLKATKELLRRILRDAQFVNLVGFTPWCTYIYDGVNIYEITEDPDFQNANSGRWAVIEVLEDGRFKITIDYMIDADSKPRTVIAENAEEVIRILSAP